MSPSNPADEVVAAHQGHAGAQVETSQPPHERLVSYIAEKVAARQCILFLGAAAHSAAPADSPYDYPRESCPPTGGQLSQRLAAVSQYPYDDTWNLQRVAQHFESSERSRFRLVEEIGRAVHQDREPSPALRMLAELEFPLVITTNYDHLYEKALRMKAAAEGDPAEEPYQVSIYSPNTQTQHKTVDCERVPNPRRPFVLKIHGDVSRPESIVVTDEDYIQFVLRMSDKRPYHPFGQNVLTHLQKWPTLFIGYRLTDYNLRLLFKTLRWRVDAANIPPSYAVDIEPDQLIRDVWENQRRYVSFIVLNLWEFIPKLYEAVKGEPPAKFYARPGPEQTP